MKKYFFIIALIFCALNVRGQEKSVLIKLVETEKSFAQAVDEKGIKDAFLEFLADDGNAVEVWKFFDGNWQIVMDVFAPIPEKK
jgi:hypothetical protein